MSGARPPIPPPPPPPGMPSLEQRPGNGLAVAAMILGIVSLVLFCFWYISAPCSILAIIFGAIGRSRAKAGASGGGMATAGLVCGAIAIGIVILAISCTMIFGVELLEWLQQMAEEAQQAGQGPAADTATEANSP